MGAHKCECFDVVGFGLINFNSKIYKLLKKFGGKMDTAVQEAVDDATAEALDAGKAFLKKQTCAAPCSRFRFVLPQVWHATPVFTGKGKEFTVHVTGQWTAYIVCYDPAKHPEGEGSDDGEGHGDDHGKQPKHSGDGDPPQPPGGKPKSPRKRGR
ncbi:MAG TPA: hypothetical protein VGH80_12845 [Xanthomonadaceae bacterium]|jgi:hypothetical protein